MYKKILVALENGPADAHLLPHICQLARQVGADLLLLHVADGWAARNFEQLKLAESDEMRADRDYLQFDPALSYGLVEYLRIIAMIEAQGWSRRRLIPHGGHQFALDIAMGLGLGGNESYPLVFKPFGGFGDDQKIVDGRIKPHEAPGIGFERKNDLYAVMKVMAEAALSAGSRRA